MKLSNEAANAACNAVVDLLDSGLIRFYTGSAPANADAAVTGTLLAELTFGATAFGAAAAGVATANAITSDSSANATGTAGYARATKTDGSSILQLTVTATGGGGDVELVTLDFVSGQPVDITAMTFTANKG